MSRRGTVLYRGKLGGSTRAPATVSTGPGEETPIAIAELTATWESRSLYMSLMAWTMASGGWLAGEGRRVLARIEVGELAKAARRAVPPMSTPRMRRLRLYSWEVMGKEGGGGGRGRGWRIISLRPRQRRKGAGHGMSYRPPGNLQRPD